MFWFYKRINILPNPFEITVFDILQCEKHSSFVMVDTQQTMMYRTSEPLIHDGWQLVHSDHPIIWQKLKVELFAKQPLSPTTNGCNTTALPRFDRRECYDLTYWSLKKIQDYVDICQQCKIKSFCKKSKCTTLIMIFQSYVS